MASDSVPQDAKAAIAGAVRDALAEHGYARLTTAKIAAESDMTEAGLYYHYDSKDEMIVAFLEIATGFLSRELDDIDADGPEAELRTAVDQLFVSHEDERQRGVNVAVMELLSHAPYNEELREPLLELERTTLDVLTDIVERGVAEGVFREVEPRGVAALILAASNGSTGFHLALGMEDVGESLREQVTLYVDSLLVEQTV